MNPIIFVHGGSGSGAQFESQGMRFTSNGYPRSHIAVVEYDSSSLSPGDSAEAAFVYGLIDARIAELQAATGKAQVFTVPADAKEGALGFGDADDEFAIARLLPNGKLDDTFGDRRTGLLSNGKRTGRTTTEGWPG